jgi:hypothetical protein
MIPPFDSDALTILRCDTHGNILGIVADGLGLAACIPIGVPFQNIVAAAERWRATDFLAAIESDGQAHDCRLTVDLTCRLKFDGAKMDDDLMLVIRRSDGALC